MSLKIIEKGNFGLITQKLNEDGTYDSVVKEVTGLISVALDSEQETANIAADDLPDYYSSKGPLRLTGTITLAGISVADYKDLFSVTEDENEVVVVGGHTEVRKLGIAFKNRASDGSINHFNLNNAKLSLPPLNTATLDETGTDIREFAIPVEANPYEYIDGQGETARVTYSIINSKKNAAIWDDVKGKIYVPDTTIA